MKVIALNYSQNCLRSREKGIGKGCIGDKTIYKHSKEKYLPYKKFLTKYGEKYSWFN